MKRMQKFGAKAAKSLLPKRKKKDNKSSAGRSLIIAGGKGMYGAAVLAASAASRVGSGYVVLMTDLSKFSSVKNPDFLTVDWKTKIHKISQSAIGIGPGLGKARTAKSLLRQLLKFRPTNVVIDADALNICSESNWFSLPSTWIATPHEGELARLLKVSSKWIQKHRVQAVQMAQQKLGCIVVLKGNHTLIADGKKVSEIQSGNSALAKAGTGDVLTGIITGLLAQGLSPFQAANLGVYIHGRIADEWLRSGQDVLSLMASDLVQNLPQVLFQIRNKKA